MPDKIFSRCIDALPSLSGRCFAITGTTSGTGYFTCEAAIKKGAAALLLLNRDSGRSDSSAAKLQEITRSTGNPTVLTQVSCDLQSFASVVKAAAEVNVLAAQYGGLDGLINNAGVMAVPDKRTADGYDVQMQTNHLSHFLLTNLVMSSLEAAADARGEARIVQHSSGARGMLPGMAEAGHSGMLEAKYMQQCEPGTLGGNELPACFNRYHQVSLLKLELRSHEINQPTIFRLS